MKYNVNIDSCQAPEKLKTYEYTIFCTYKPNEKYFTNIYIVCILWYIYAIEFILRIYLTHPAHGVFVWDCMWYPLYTVFLTYLG